MHYRLLRSISPCFSRVSSPVTAPRAALGACAVLSLLAAPQVASAQTLLGSYYYGSLLNVSTTNGATTLIGNTGTVPLLGITYRPQDGRLYGLDIDTFRAKSYLRTINPTTGATSLVGEIGFSFGEGDIAADPTTGTIYGFAAFTPNYFGMVTINPLTGVGTPLADLSAAGDPSAAAFDASGQLWVLDTSGTGNSRLLQVNKTNGAITSTLSLSADLQGLAGMSFQLGTGTLYVADGIGNADPFNLYTVNLQTGQLSTVGSTGVLGGLTGLAFVPSAAIAAPEPGSLALLLPAVGTMGIVGVVIRKRRIRGQASENI